MALESLKQYAAEREEDINKAINEIISDECMIISKDKKFVIDELESRTVQTYKNYQDSIIKSGMIRSDITKRRTRGAGPD